MADENVQVTQDPEKTRLTELLKSQLAALDTMLKKVQDPAARQRVARVMLLEVEKDQASGVEKVLQQVMRGNAHAAAIHHLDYFMRLEPIANRLREEAFPQDSGLSAVEAQNRANLKQRGL